MVSMLQQLKDTESIESNMGENFENKSNGFILFLLILTLIMHIRSCLHMIFCERTAARHHQQKSHNLSIIRQKIPFFWANVTALSLSLNFMVKPCKESRLSVS